MFEKKMPSKKDFTFDKRMIIGIRDYQWYSLNHDGKNKPNDIKCVILEDKSRKMTQEEADILNKTCWVNHKDVHLFHLELIVKNFRRTWHHNAWLYKQLKKNKLIAMID